VRDESEVGIQEGNVSKEFDDLMELLRGMKVSFDRGRNSTHPCTFCAAPAEPNHELVTIGKYGNGRDLTRPVCVECMPVARAVSGEKSQPSTTSAGE